MVRPTRAVGVIEPVIRVGSVLIGMVLVAVPIAKAQESNVADTVHNLSVSGPGEIKSESETEVCKFCHIPHTAVVPKPLWGHKLSEEANYRVPKIKKGRKGEQASPQPDGSTRLCLSCHDGTIALGDISGEPRLIKMRGKQKLAAGRKGYLGTDLSGSHPVSFKVTDDEHGFGEGDDGRDMGIKSLSVIKSDRQVRLDDEGKMQCTTCHDPHSDKYYIPGKVPRFWVKPSVGELCLTCHELR